MDVLCEIRNHIAFITLNRPAALNALSLDMIIQMRAALHRFAVDSTVRAVFIKGAGEKAFCAGGDIRALYDSYKSSGAVHLEFFAQEYPLDYLLRNYPKPYVALLDGITMGGGMGIAQGASLRIVGDRTRMAMPEVAIGFFPDVGASYFLSRLAGGLGPYLALTGAHIRAADAIYVGLADIYLPREPADRLESELDSFAWNHDIGDFIRGMAIASAGDPPLATVRPAIDQHFSADSLPSLLSSLAAESRPEYLSWARQSLQLIQARSPTMVTVALMQLKLGRSMSFADCLRMEIGMAQQAFNQGDFVEGIRAMVIDKDNLPKWRPGRVEEVQDTDVRGIFRDPWTSDTHPLKNLESEFKQSVAE